MTKPTKENIDVLTERYRDGYGVKVNATPSEHEALASAVRTRLKQETSSPSGSDE